MNFQPAQGPACYTLLMRGQDMLPITYQEEITVQVLFIAMVYLPVLHLFTYMCTFAFSCKMTWKSQVKSMKLMNIT